MWVSWSFCNDQDLREIKKEVIILNFMYIFSTKNSDVVLIIDVWMGVVFRVFFVIFWISDEIV